MKTENSVCTRVICGPVMSCATLAIALLLAVAPRAAAEVTFQRTHRECWIAVGADDYELDVNRADAPDVSVAAADLQATLLDEGLSAFGAAQLTTDFQAAATPGVFDVLVCGWLEFSVDLLAAVMESAYVEGAAYFQVAIEVPSLGQPMQVEMVAAEINNSDPWLFGQLQPWYVAPTLILPGDSQLFYGGIRRDPELRRTDDSADSEGLWWRADFTYTLRLTPVPEPTAFGLLAMSGLALLRRRAIA